MSVNKMKGLEEVDVDGVIYVFKADFDFLQSVKDRSGIDPIFIYNHFESGEGDPKIVLNVLMSSIVSISGVAVVPDDVEQICKDLVTVKGLQEAVILCRYMMTYSMIGDKKKYQIMNLEQTQMIIDQLKPFPLRNFRNHLLLWVYVALISGVCACLNFRTLEALIALKMG